MFDLVAKRLAWLTVKWKGFASSGDGSGEVVEYEVEVQVELVERDLFAELFVEPITPEDRAGSATIAARYEAMTDTARAENDARLEAFRKWDDLGRFKRVATNWRGVVANGQPLEFTADNVGHMMQVANFPLAFFQAYADAWQGIGETRKGNSEGSPAPGPVASESK